MGEAKSFKTAQGLRAAVRAALAADGRDAGSIKWWVCYRESRRIKGGSVTSLVALPPKGTRADTLERIVSLLGEGRVERVRSPFPARSSQQLAVVVDVAAPTKRGGG